MAAPSDKVNRKQLRQQQRERERRQQRRNQLLGRMAVAVVAVVLIAAVVWLILRPKPGIGVADLGRQHIPDGVPVEYNSNPPTSGPHYGSPAAAGVYDHPVPDGNLVHSLEHGYIVISFNCDAGSQLDCDTLTGNITQLARSNRLWKLIVVPRQQLEVPVAVTAWRRIDRLDDYDPDRINAFIRHWRDKGPEATEM